MSNQIDYSQFYDGHATDIKDFIPNDLVKVYPYLLPNTTNSIAFMQGNTTTLAYMTQNGLETDTQNLKADEDGLLYFEMFFDLESNTKLDISSATSVFGQELKEEVDILGLSNWYYEGELDKVQMGSFKLVPAIFSIGRPFDRVAYEKGEQPLFVSERTVEAKGGTYNKKNQVIDTEGMYETELINITALESSFVNSRILFTTSFDTATNDILTFDGGKNGITLGFENQTLINFVKGKGGVSEFSTAGVNEDIEFGDIDFVSNQALAPFKMTPVSIQDKLTMYADWFDYDVVLPFVFIEKFKAGAKLDEVIPTKKDREMVENMLAVSAGFANSWSDAPVLSTGGDAGKIDPNFRVGSRGLKVQALANKDPIQVVDGIYETYLREEPGFITQIARYQPVKEVLCALSRYLYSSYSIGRGQNSFNSAYLPWYLEPSIGTPIKFNREIEITNPDKSSGNTKVKTYVLDENITYQALTSYYHKDYTAVTTPEYAIKQDLILPKNVDISNIKLIQTDRKLTLPEVPDQISPINKRPLPGDINTQSSQDLNYMWYLPITDQTVFEKLFLNSLTTQTSVQAGEVITVDLNRSNAGVIPTAQEIRQETLRQVPGDIKVPANPIIKPDPAVRAKPYFANIGQAGFKITGGPGNVNIPYKNPEGNLLSDRGFLKQVIARTLRETRLDGVLNDIDEASIEFVNKGPLFRPSSSEAFFLKYAEFTQASVQAKSSTGSVYKFEERQTLFDKQKWKRFLSKFNVIPNQTTYYELLEKDGLQIKRLNEIIIGSVFGNFVELKVNGSLIAKIPLFNKDDETIGVQRILFT